MAKFINISNHPSDKWNSNQLSAAKEYGDVIDIPFPQIDPMSSANEVRDIATEYATKVEQYDAKAVMVQGEFTFSYALIKILKERGMTVVASCSKRNVEEHVMPDGSVMKNSIFEFCGFREYI